MESKWKVSPQLEVIIVDNKRWNKIVENQIKFLDVAKEWMHRWMMENVHKIKIKLENIWIDLIMGIYAPYSEENHSENTYVNVDIRLDPDGELLLTDCYTELHAAATRQSKRLLKRQKSCHIEAEILNAGDKPSPPSKDTSSVSFSLHPFFLTHPCFTDISFHATMILLSLT